MFSYNVINVHSFAFINPKARAPALMKTASAFLSFVESFWYNPNSLAILQHIKHQLITFIPYTHSATWFSNNFIFLHWHIVSDKTEFSNGFNASTNNSRRNLSCRTSFLGFICPLSVMYSISLRIMIFEFWEGSWYIHLQIFVLSCYYAV